MWKDPIVEEVRANREAYAKRFGYDLRKIVADLIKKQEARAASSEIKDAKKPARTKRKQTPSKRRKAA